MPGVAFPDSISDTGRRPGFLFGDYSKGRQRYLRPLPCLGPLPRLSAAPSESPTLKRARHRAQFGNALRPGLAGYNNGLGWLAREDSNLRMAESNRALWFCA